MDQLSKLFPQKIATYYEPFVGGGSSLINTKADSYVVNDIDENVIGLHHFLSSFSFCPDTLFEALFNTIKNYGLSCSYKNSPIPDQLKKLYPKTYFAKFNHDPYSKMKDDYNKNHSMFLLYLLLIYGFNHMTRFNSKGQFNLPVGNVDFNKNVVNALTNYLSFIGKSKIVFKSGDYRQFLLKSQFEKNDFIYLDPPYLISMSEYNSLWNDKKEREMCLLLDQLNSEGIHWGITNLISHKGRTNAIFMEWCRKYKVYPIKSNYISFNDNTIKSDSKEVYVTNYGPSNL
jgi:DNA adenine methylase Dam